MNAISTPANVAELAEAVRSAPRVIPVGAGTKPRLSAVDAMRISTAKISGIVDYEPSEFTFTALAGTPVRDLAAAIAECGQYLPFDPMLTGAGATLGGTVASGVSGPGRFRFGGLRDFILGVQFVDSTGRLLRMGGKVVKNAAGFDLPKFFVGSLGRFGVLAEITFKVFPRPTSRLTLMLEAKTPEVATTILTRAASARWEIEALDWLPDARFVAIRLAGPTVALDKIAEEILKRWPGERLSSAVADERWSLLSEFCWTDETFPSSPGNSPEPAETFPGEGQSRLASAATPQSILLKIPTTPEAAAPLRQALEELGSRVHVSAGGNVAFAAFAPGADSAVLDASLSRLQVSALTLRGNAPLWLGARRDLHIATAVKAALDPENRFPTLQD